VPSQTPEQFSATVAEELRTMLARRRHRPFVDDVAVEGVFPFTDLIVRFGRHGYRYRLFTDEDGNPLGDWVEILARYPMYGDQEAMAAELWVEVEEGLDSRVWRDEWSEQDGDGVRWIVK
jgi:hypothetical protein